MSARLVTCIMPTANRRQFVPAAIARFLAQDHPDKELVVLDNGHESVADLVLAHPSIRYVRETSLRTLGALRNRACELAGGDIIAHWDDDDWYPNDRLSRQLNAMTAANADVCGSSRLYFRDADRRLAWEFALSPSGRRWVAGATLAYRKASWERNRFREVQIGEDSHFVWSHAARHIADLADPGLCVAAIHAGNTSPKRPAGACWKAMDPALLDRIIAHTEREEQAAVVAAGVARGRALMAVASGIGDVIRTTPLIRVLHRLGYAVDVLSGADYPETTDLLAGAPEVQRVFSFSSSGGVLSSTELAGIEYDVACFSYWAQRFEPQVRAKARQRFDRAMWIREGDSNCVARVARDLGWKDALPPPFVIVAPRRFDLPHGTVALHAGCKRGWPWKKWHGFAELAERLEHVVLVGTGEDLDVARTYFGREFRWPDHVRNYIGQLSLPETAALIQQCAALVCNDSGMQHIGAAVGTPTYPIFGITSPAREIIPVAHVRPVTKGLACEPDCRRQPWGRRDCHNHLECLKTMAPNEVLERITNDGVVVPTRAGPAPRFAEPVLPAETLSIAVRVDGGIGDVLLASPLIEALFEDLKRCEIDVFYHQPDAAKFVFSSARFVRSVYPTLELASTERHYDMTIRTLQFIRYAVRDHAKLQRVCPEFATRLPEISRRFDGFRGLADRQPALDGLWGRISLREGRGVLDSIGFLGGVDVTRDSEFFLAPDPAAHRVLETHVGDFGQLYVTLHDGFDNSTAIPAGAATKCWPLEHWQRLCAELKARHPAVRLVQIGSRKSRHIPGVDIDLVDRTSLHEAAWIMKNAQLHIDSDSGLAHLARALHTSAIVLFGPTDAGYYGHACNTNIAAAGCSNCWWSTPDWLSRCPRGLARPECMESIRPETVLEHATQRLAVARAAIAEAGAVTCYDGALCRTGQAKLAGMCAALDLPLLPISQHIKNVRSGVYIHASKQWEYLYALDALAQAFGAGRTGLRIADLGGGRGALGPYLATEGQRVEIFDIDYLWDHGGDVAIERRFRQWAKGVAFRAGFGSLYNLPVASGSFDAVTCISVVEHVPYKEYVLKEALRILRPGGLLILTFDFANSPERFEDGMRREIFSPDRLARTLQKLGMVLAPPNAEAVARSARFIQADGVCGIPVGMTVAAMVIRKP